MSVLIKIFFHSKSSIIALLLLLIFGIISLQFGKNFLEKNKDVIVQVTEKKRKNTIKNINNHSNDLGLFLYYQKFALVNQAPNIAGLSIGLRNTNPTIKDFTIRNLEEQKYSSELNNPFYQLFGNMDFSFALIYFFPLVIIILCFNIVSQEKESKRWNIMQIQTSKPLRVLYFKVLIRYLAVISVALILFTLAKVYLSIPLSQLFLVLVVLSILYISFWFSLCTLIISFNQSGSSSLLYSLIIWVLLAIIAPILLSSITKESIPIPETYQTALKSREGYHEKWDLDKATTIKKFQAEYPQFSKYEHPKGKHFSWLWYYAMQHMGDLTARNDALKLFEKVNQRIDFMSKIGAFFPSIHTQLSLNSLAHSDLKNYTKFLSELERLHEQKRLDFYPKIFTHNTTGKEDWDINNILPSYVEERQINFLYMLFPLVITILFMMAWTRRNIKIYFHK